MALFVITNYSKQKQNKKHMALFAIMDYGKQRANTKNTWHCLLSWTTESKSKTKNA
jgi:hypothetical protein